MSELDNIKY